MIITRSDDTDGAKPPNLTSSHENTCGIMRERGVLNESTETIYEAIKSRKVSLPYAARLQKPSREHNYISEYLVN